MEGVFCLKSGLKRCCQIVMGWMVNLNIKASLLIHKAALTYQLGSPLVQSARLFWPQAVGLCHLRGKLEIRLLEIL